MDTITNWKGPTGPVPTKTTKPKRKPIRIPLELMGTFQHMCNAWMRTADNGYVIYDIPNEKVRNDAEFAAVLSKQLGTPVSPASIAKHRAVFHLGKAPHIVINKKPREQKTPGEVVAKSGNMRRDVDDIVSYLTYLDANWRGRK